MLLAESATKLPQRVATPVQHWTCQQDSTINAYESTSLPTRADTLATKEESTSTRNEDVCGSFLSAIHKCFLAEVFVALLGALR